MKNKYTEQMKKDLLTTISVIVWSAVCGVLIGFGLGGINAVADLDKAMKTTCVQEDSPNCFWDASVSGNGIGESFIDVNGTAHYFK